MRFLSLPFVLFVFKFQFLWTLLSYFIIINPECLQDMMFVVSGCWGVDKICFLCLDYLIESVLVWFWSWFIIGMFCDTQFNAKKLCSINPTYAPNVWRCIEFPHNYLLFVVVGGNYGHLSLYEWLDPCLCHESINYFVYFLLSSS